MNELTSPSFLTKPDQRRPRGLAQPWWLLLVTHLALLTAGLVYLWRWEPAPEIVSKTHSSSSSVRARSATWAPAEATATDVPAPHLIQPDARTIGSSIAAELNAPDGTGERDVQTLLSLVRLYSRRLHGRPAQPIGNDSDLARVLMGRNPMKVVILPPSNPAVSSDGRLRDRWGTPYFIHPLGHNQFDIRSAGPDRKMFTEDDVVADPAWQDEDNE